MGHVTGIISAPEKCDRRQVQARLDREAACEDWKEGGTGLPKDIRRLDSVPVQKDRKTAEKYINDHDTGDYDQLAVRFYAPAGPASSKRLEELMARYSDAAGKYRELERSDYFEKHKSRFVTCKSCGSSLNIEKKRGHEEKEKEKGE